MPPKPVPITSADLEKLQQNIMESIQTQFQDFKSQFEQVMSEMNSFKESLNSKVADLEAELQASKSELIKTNEELSALKKKVSDIDCNIDDVEAQDRITHVLISGEGTPVYTVGENSTSVALNMVENCLKLKMAPSDIISAERFGPKPQNQQPDKRSLLLKLANRDIKRNLIVTSKKTRSSIYINEFLTKRRRSIFFALRSIRKRHPSLIAGCATIDGKVCA